MESQYPEKLCLQITKSPIYTLHIQIAKLIAILSTAKTKNS